jgi:hypothetical protein
MLETSNDAIYFWQKSLSKESNAHGFTKRGMENGAWRAKNGEQELGNSAAKSSLIPHPYSLIPKKLGATPFNLGQNLIFIDASFVLHSEVQQAIEQRV